MNENPTVAHHRPRRYRRRHLCRTYPRTVVGGGARSAGQECRSAIGQNAPTKRREERFAAKRNKRRFGGSLWACRPREGRQARSRDLFLSDQAI